MCSRPVVIVGKRPLYLNAHKVISHRLRHIVTYNNERNTDNRTDYRADVKVGGDPNHPVGHAHIYEGSKDLASIDVNGNIFAGKLTPGAAKFVKNNLTQIAEGIMQYYYLK